MSRGEAECALRRAAVVTEKGGGAGKCRPVHAGWRLFLAWPRQHGPDAPPLHALILKVCENSQENMNAER